jgi:hypothetical protein
MNHRKPAAVSMTAQLYEQAKARAHELGFPTFSAYVCQLIRSDIHHGGQMSIVQESAPSAKIPPREGDVTYTPAKKPHGARS